MVAEQNGLNDGADEQMLSGAEDNEKLADKREEVKFIKGGDHQNGDAKIDIGAVNGKVRKIKNKKKFFFGINEALFILLRTNICVQLFTCYAG